LQPDIKMRKALAIVLAVVLASSCALPFLSSEGEAAGTHNETGARVIEKGDYVLLKAFRTEHSSSIFLEITKGSGGGYNLLLLDGTNYSDLRDGEAFAYRSGTILNATNSIEIVPLSTPLVDETDYYLVVDNSGSVPGGAAPTGAIGFTFVLTLQNVTLIAPSNITLGIIVAIAAAALVVVALVVVFLIYASRGRKRAASEAVPSLRSCPNCRSYVPENFEFCPTCGMKL